MNFKWNKTDKELVVTYYDGDEQLQFVIEPNVAIWTGEDSDRQLKKYPQWAFELKEWLENKLNNKK